MRPTPRIIKAIDPDDLIAQVQASLEMGEDLIQSPFISHEGLICQRVVSMMCVYEYTLIRANDLDDLQKQEQTLTDLGYDFVFDTVLWNGKYIQWMHRFNSAGLAVRDAVTSLYVQSERAQELALVEGVREYMHIQPLADDALVTIPFPTS